jgi:Mg-chelatase subunit ChlD
VERVAAARQRRIESSRNTLLHELNKGITDALKSGDLEKANRIHDEVDAVRDSFSDVAFICDTSGSMMEQIETAKGFIDKHVGQLGVDQQFSITFFSGGRTSVLDQQLVRATLANKQRAENFLQHAAPYGPTDPIPALDLAYAQHPQLIYVITDGEFPNNARVLAEIHRLDPERKIKVNTVVIVGSSNRDVNLSGSLQKIAADSGGDFQKLYIGKK